MSRLLMAAVALLSLAGCGAPTRNASPLASTSATWVPVFSQKVPGWLWVGEPPVPLPPTWFVFTHVPGPDSCYRSPGPADPGELLRGLTSFYADTMPTMGWRLASSGRPAHDFALSKCPTSGDMALEENGRFWTSRWTHRGGDPVDITIWIRNLDGNVYMDVAFETPDNLP